MCSKLATYICCKILDCVDFTTWLHQFPVELWSADAAIRLLPWQCGLIWHVTIPDVTVSSSRSCNEYILLWMWSNIILGCFDLLLQNLLNNKMSSDCETKSQHRKANIEVDFHDGVKNGTNGFHRSQRSSKQEEFEATPLLIAVITYTSYAILIAFGYLRDFLRYYGLERSRGFTENGNKVGIKQIAKSLQRQQIMLISYPAHGPRDNWADLFGILLWF